MKKILILLFIAAFTVGQKYDGPAPVSDGYTYLSAVATAADVFKLDDGTEIKIYNDRLQVGKTYFLYVHTADKSEILDYIDLETYELETMN